MKVHGRMEILTDHVFVVFWYMTIFYVLLVTLVKMLVTIITTPLYDLTILCLTFIFWKP